MMDRKTFLAGVPAAVVLASRWPKVDESPLTVTEIDWPRDYGDNDNPVPIEQVIQQILDDNCPGISLQCIGSPEFGILRYEQQPMPVADAVQNLVDLIPWDVRQAGPRHLILSEAP